MWNKDITKATQGKYYPIWVEKDGRGLNICATILGTTWYSNNEPLSFYGFNFVAWYDLPPYEEE